MAIGGGFWVAVRDEIKEILYIVAKKWSKISARQNPSFCPAIYIYGLSTAKITELKKQIYLENFWFVDAFPFKGSDLAIEHFYLEPSSVNKIKFRFIDTLDDLPALVSGSEKRVEIYQFYKDQE